MKEDANFVKHVKDIHWVGDMYDQGISTKDMESMRHGHADGPRLGHHMSGDIPVAKREDIIVHPSSKAAV